ncbi:hypothetical protein FIBSPDRAFT_115520 [Athelia psychrophila]|uniref:Uncharacterized protein n=1 Tax=Athelia psychrophila TaxID=1759441 RepID=A0A166CYW1_9AGAM|nr:hypothetical protein FIBSPDRAFT_115520 [Fibularhizoctonia sp. CBS 109695]
MVVAHERAAALCAAAAGALSGLGHCVCYTYAPITIDRALFIKKGRLLLFMQADSHAIALALPNAILLKIESAGSAEWVAENDHLTTCVFPSPSPHPISPSLELYFLHILAFFLYILLVSYGLYVHHVLPGSRIRSLFRGFRHLYECSRCVP